MLIAYNTPTTIRAHISHCIFSEFLSSALANDLLYFIVLSVDSFNCFVGNLQVGKLPIYFLHFL